MGSASDVADHQRPDLAIVHGDVASIVDRLGDRVGKLSGATVGVTGASGMVGGFLSDVLADLNASGILPGPMAVNLFTRTHPAPGSRLEHLVGRTDITIHLGETGRALPIASRVDYVV